MMTGRGGSLDEGSPSTVSGARPVPGAGAPGIRLFERGTALGARFEIGEVRGVGGSAVVYSAFDRELKLQVALKVLRADRTSPEALTRLKREVAVARHAASTRLVRVYDIDAAEESVFLTMEDVPGGSLKERLAEGPLPLEDALRIAGEVLEGLGVLHGLGIVHRDVKPGNVLLTEEGSVKLADFGLARRLEVDETRATSVNAFVGTVDYVSPEQALGRELDGRSDLYSFGVTLYEMATGGIPFKRDSAIGTALAHVKDPPPRLRSARPDAPAWLEAFVSRLLAKSPEERYATAEDALADLGARRVTGAARSGRRRAIRLAAGGLVAAALLAALAADRLLAPRSPARLIASGRAENGIVAVDDRGRALWERKDVCAAAHATIFRLAEGSARVAAVVTDGKGYIDPAGARVDVLDPATGATLDSLRIPPPELVAGYEAGGHWGAAGLSTVNLDGAGADELVLSVHLVESFPSVTFFLEPETRLARPVFIASGHHALAGAADLDGDGRKELVLVGTANRLGLRVGVAALRVAKPAEEVRGMVTVSPSFALTPDDYAFEQHRSELLWYALGPPSRGSLGRAVAVDETRRTVRVEGLSSSPFTLGFDGFPAGVASSLPARDRAAARDRCWTLFGRAGRLAAAGDVAAALAVAREAVGTIGPAGDPELLAWARTTEARHLVLAGDEAAADALYGGLAEAAAEIAPVSLDAARAFHLAGDLSRAAKWYATAVSGKGAPEEEWIVQAALEGAVLVELERKDPEAALALVERAPIRNEVFGELRDLVAWRTGRAVAPRPDAPATTALRRYWRLEEELVVLGGSGARLLPGIEAERRAAGQAAELFDLVEAEILLRQRQFPQAWAKAGTAFSALWARRSRDVTARAHLGLAADRTARAAEAVGRRAEAARIRTDVRRFLAAAR
jgi:tRNA A-37 threonylcarbamoyl transferase component Bud32